MPQTTEEHMELENDDDDKSDSEKNVDGEVSRWSGFLGFASQQRFLTDNLFL